MPKLQQVVEPTEAPVVDVDTELTPTQAQQVRQACREYQALDAQIKVLEHRRDEKKGQLGALRDEVGVISLTFEGFKVTLVGGLRKVLNKKKLIALGCAKAWLDEATEDKVVKPYERVTLPGQRDRSTSDDDD
jgi:hypothetical protein